MGMLGPAGQWGGGIRFASLLVRGGSPVSVRSQAVYVGIPAAVLLVAGRGSGVCGGDTLRVGGAEQEAVFGMGRVGWVVVVVLVGWALSPLCAPVRAAPACGLNLRAPEIQTAVKSLPSLPQSYPWDSNPQSFDPSSNYDPCAVLSAVIISVEGATGSSPELAVFFHNGSYVGIATSKAYAFTTLNAAKTTDDTVALDYKDGRNVCTACPGPITTVRYQWQSDHVAMLDPAPQW
ncbi:hypothetical protein MB901379_01380 [Mycobacterium basiliense]|uniref:LppP/LprE lipoprotein n=1 Tax=Mycobacterium basiliense TaxID=2094119 RepID=A0A3S5CZM1_9MYCO|nr:LppP/LprE family lipoprotein [Mycobacterium basiliense]VDM87830.1 hypothetical protein MB901379_01380 [Mycobacterium basiliense]